MQIQTNCMPFTVRIFSQINAQSSISRKENPAAAEQWRRTRAEPAKFSSAPHAELHSEERGENNANESVVHGHTMKRTAKSLA
jgi:hypothetical protein